MSLRVYGVDYAVNIAADRTLVKPELDDRSAYTTEDMQTTW
jgi:hypothetical protein